jgi:hypothetical protein
MQQLIGMLAEMREKMETKLDTNTKATLATQVKMNETKEDMKSMQENYTRETEENDGRNDDHEPSEDRRKF